jgi:hypothetical protein
MLSAPKLRKIGNGLDLTSQSLRVTLCRMEIRREVMRNRPWGHDGFAILGFANLLRGGPRVYPDRITMDVDRHRLG